MNPITKNHYDLKLTPVASRVILRPFISTSLKSNLNIIQRALSLTEKQTVDEFKIITEEFGGRHLDFEASVLSNYQLIKRYVNTPEPISRDRQLLLGSLFSGEYALEAAALFNPSIVPHPDQSGVSAGYLRFIMSLRATGEGHISSIEFRAGTLSSDSGKNLKLEKVSRYVNTAHAVLNPTYQKHNILIYLKEMGIYESHIHAMFEYLEDSFTRSQLMKTLSLLKRKFDLGASTIKHLGESLKWYVNSNYEIQFAKDSALSERAIFPHSQTESSGMEDARFVKFQEENGASEYYATYTAYNKNSISPQLVSTRNFQTFRISTLNGSGVKNKGMALFPRRVKGLFAMLSRQDDQNLAIMYSTNLYQWKDPVIIMHPKAVWEFVKIGNCGSPLETEAGWLVLTHGVGPMRKYGIGAVLLDLADPSKVIGRLKTPLLQADGEDREGYVPNVAYSCGSLIFRDDLILPYALSDTHSGMVRISLKDIFADMEMN